VTVVFWEQILRESAFGARLVAAALAVTGVGFVAS
jgi:hypothetical protein